MTTEKDGGPAFPHVVRQLGYGDERLTEGGMSLRDWFAGQALVAVISACAKDHGALDAYTHLGSPAPYFARRAFDVADAMLAEREK